MSSAVAVFRDVTWARSRPLLICYLPVGDPLASAATAGLYADHGVDVVEAGLAVDRPVMDGTEITSSMARAVGAGHDGQAGADLLAGQLSRSSETAAVWMSYHRDPDNAYLATVAGSGVGAVLLPDADQSALARRAQAHDLTTVPFLDHEPRADQLAAARANDQTYVMLAAASGITGERASVGDDNREILRTIRASGVDAPVALGFGISTAEHARKAVALGADGVIVGSACVRAAREGHRALSTLLAALRRALDE